jgi:hypothetical protein
MASEEAGASGQAIAGGVACGERGSAGIEVQAVQKPVWPRMRAIGS